MSCGKWKPKFSNFLCISYLCCPSKLFFFCFLRAKMMRLLLMRSFLCCLSPPPLKAALAASSLLACMVSPIPAVVVASSHLCKGLVAPFPFHWLRLVPNKYQKDDARWEPMPSPGAHTGTKPEFVSENSIEIYFRQDEISSFSSWTLPREREITI